MACAFHAAHDRLYGYSLADTGTELELINIRVRSIGQSDSIELTRLNRGQSDSTHALKGKRRAWVFERAKFEELLVYDGHALLAENQIVGPALIERNDTTIFVSAGFDAKVDALGSVVLKAREVSDA